jgi:hypothetical protein
MPPFPPLQHCTATEVTSPYHALYTQREYCESLVPTFGTAGTSLTTASPGAKGVCYRINTPGTFTSEIAFTPTPDNPSQIYIDQTIQAICVVARSDGTTIDCICQTQPPSAPPPPPPDTPPPPPPSHPPFSPSPTPPPPISPPPRVPQYESTLFGAIAGGRATAGCGTLPEQRLNAQCPQQFAEARVHCENMGGFLALPRNAQEATQVQAVINAGRSSGAQKAWIGVNDVDAEVNHWGGYWGPRYAGYAQDPAGFGGNGLRLTFPNKYRWRTTTMTPTGSEPLCDAAGGYSLTSCTGNAQYLVDEGFHAWGGSDPSDSANTNDNCVRQIFASGGNGWQWEPKACTIWQPFVCWGIIPPSPPPVSPPPPSAPPSPPIQPSYLCHEGYRCDPIGTAPGDYTIDQCLNLCSGLSGTNVISYASDSYDHNAFPTLGTCLCSQTTGCVSIVADPQYNVWTRGQADHCERPPALPPSPPPIPPSPPPLPSPPPPRPPPNYELHCLQPLEANSVAGNAIGGGTTYATLSEAADGCYNVLNRIGIVEFSNIYYCRSSDGTGDVLTAFSGATFWRYKVSCTWG